MTALSVTPHRYTIDEAMREVDVAKLEIDPYGHISGAALRWCETVLGSAFGFPVRVREEPEFSRHLEIVPLCHAGCEHFVGPEVANLGGCRINAGGGRDRYFVSDGETVCKRSAL